MRKLLALLLVPILLSAGCVGRDAPVEAAGGEAPPASGVPSAPGASTDAPGEGEAASEVALPTARGEFAVVAQTPWPQPSCPSTATVLAPAPAEGARVSFDLPEGSRRVTLEFSDTALTGGSAYVLCAFQEGKLVGDARGVSPVRFALDAAPGPLEVLVSAEPFPDALVNVDAMVEWTLGGVALVAPAA